MRPLPQELIASLETVTGFDKDSFIAAHGQSPVTSIRINPAKAANVFQEAQQIPWCTEGRYLNERPVFTLDPAFHAGAYYVQEASSMFLDHMLKSLLPNRDHLTVLDLCGAPGGKSTLIASCLGENSLLISNEVIRTRAVILEENVVRWGYPNNWVTSNDPRDFGALKGYFDVIIVDAPCSGSGLFRKDERALDEWSVNNVQLCSQRQQRILADVWGALKEDGILIYATCSYSSEEDEQILDWLAENFEVQSLSVDVPAEWGIVATVTGSKMTGYRFFPGKANGEGFFIAAVQKKEHAGETKHPKFKSQLHKDVVEHSQRLLAEPERFTVLEGKDSFFAINKEHEGDYHILSKALYLRKTGVTLGSPAGKDWIPAHEAALSIYASANIASIDVSKDQALKFLKKEDMGLPALDKGWQLIKYNGLALGWIKSLGNRVNNYLPKQWRIRMELPSEWD